MSIPLTTVFDVLPHALHLVLILVVALIAKRLLRSATNKLARPAAAPLKGAQQKDQQSRKFAESIYRVGSGLLWMAAVLTALPEFGISALPGALLGGAAILGISVGARNTIRDLFAGFHILSEDQFMAGDTVQAGEFVGRVESVTLRRTVLRDGRGALVSISNGEMRTVSNLSRDWSQAYVDVGIAVSTPLESTLQALEKAAAELRGDTAWSAAIVDGPRVLGVQEYDDDGATLRLQVRTAPTRQDEVCRELRRRIQMEFQRQGIGARGSGSDGATNTALT
jgi:small-conductance mechanosensitive channel